MRFGTSSTHRQEHEHEHTQHEYGYEYVSDRGPKPGTCVVDDELVVVGGVLIPGVRFEVSVQVAYSSVFVLHSDISALLA